MRSIVSVNEGGIGNRLSCIMFSYYVRNKHFPDRNFYVYWPITENFACPWQRLINIDSKYILSLDDFHSMLCEWVIGGDVPNVLVQNNSNPAKMDFNRWNEHHYVFNTIPWNEKLIARNIAWDYAINENLLSISGEVYNRMAEMDFNTKKCVGIHVRRGDVIWHNRCINLKKYFRYIDDNYPEDNIYVAAEDTTGEIRRAFVQRYGKNRIHKYPAKGYDRHNEEHCFDAFVDWVLLSRTRCIVGGESSYSGMASWLGQTPLVVF